MELWWLFSSYRNTYTRLKYFRICDDVNKKLRPLCSVTGTGVKYVPTYRSVKRKSVLSYKDWHKLKVSISLHLLIWTGSYYFPSTDIHIYWFELEVSTTLHILMWSRSQYSPTSTDLNRKSVLPYVCWYELEVSIFLHTIIVWNNFEFSF